MKQETATLGPAPTHDMSVRSLNSINSLTKTDAIDDPVEMHTQRQRI
ncbi:MAG: hypothetical protein ABGZ23_23000 [Fuerstiella sp.]